MPFGTLVIRNDFLDIVDINKYYETSHAYSGYIVEYLNYIQSKTGRCNILVSNDLIVYLRTCLKTWSDKSFIIYYDEIPKWFKLLPQNLNKSLEKNIVKYMNDIFNLKFLLKNKKSIKRIYFLDIYKELRVKEIFKLGIVNFISKFMK